MYSEYNHIYTNKGIYSVYDLYDLKMNDKLDTIKVMSYDLLEHTYYFADIYDVLVSEDEQNIYEIRFDDIYSDKVSIVNATGDMLIYQYDIVSTDITDYLQKNKVKVNQYIQAVNTSSVALALNLNFKTTSINSLINFSNNMPNICLGDTLLKYVSKTLKHLEVGYRIIDSNNNDIPLFIGQSVNAFYNFILTSN